MAVREPNTCTTVGAQAWRNDIVLQGRKDIPGARCIILYDSVMVALFHVTL